MQNNQGSTYIINQKFGWLEIRRLRENENEICTPVALFYNFVNSDMF